MNKRFDVIIMGGGMTGLAMANALADSSLQIAVIDHTDMDEQTLPAFDGRVCAIALGSRYILEQMGAWEEMASHAEPILDIFVHEAGGFGAVHYDHQEVGSEPMGYIVENRHTRLALQQRAKQYDFITFYAPAKVVAVTTQNAKQQVQLASGELIEAALLIAADGRRSFLREQAGVLTLFSDYHQTAIVATISHSEPHYGVAIERFFPSGPFAVLPMQEQRSSLVWVEPTEVADALMGLSKQELMPYLQEKMQGYLGEIEWVGEVSSYPLSVLYATSFVANRLAIIGDAAHGMHPIAGQGANLGFRDVEDLAKVLKEAALCGEDIGSAGVLQRYAGMRRIDAVSMLAATDGLNRLFSNDVWPIKIARNTGFSAVNHMPSLRKRFMQHAMGQ